MVHNGRFFRGGARQFVMGLNGGKCIRCGNIATAADHIWPWALGGKTIIGNGQPLCTPCNSKKGCKPPIAGLDLPHVK